MAVHVSSDQVDLDCHKCSEEAKIINGCVEDSPIPDVWGITGQDIAFQRCPLKVVTGQSLEYIQAYSLFLKGYLPNHGGWLEQPVKFIQAVMIIDREVERIKMKELNKRKD